jgi:heme-degrading monooxygenase HmoA
MIGRIWHGWAAREDADAYQAMLNSDVLPGIHRIPGYRGAYVMRREVGDEVEFITMTIFENMKAVKQFAGEDYTKAVIQGPAQKLLKRSDDRSTHFEIILAPENGPRGE